MSLIFLTACSFVTWVDAPSVKSLFAIGLCRAARAPWLHALMRLDKIQVTAGTLLRLGHRHMRALCHERIELLNAARGQNFGGEWKQQIGVIVARLVRNDRQHTRTRRDSYESLLNDLAQFGWRQIKRGEPVPTTKGAGLLLINGYLKPTPNRA